MSPPAARREEALFINIPSDRETEYLHTRQFKRKKASYVGEFCNTYSKNCLSDDSYDRNKSVIVTMVSCDSNDMIPKERLRKGNHCWIKLIIPRASQIDDEGHRHLLLADIIDFRRDDTAVEKNDALVIMPNGVRRRKLTTRGWQLLCQWNDGSTNWVSLKDTKESYPM